MRIDCRDLECPKPVLKSKEALENLALNEELIIVLNSQIAKENVERFLKNLNYTPQISSKNGEFTLRIVKDKELLSSQEMPSCENLAKSILFLKSCKVGEGELGQNLFVGFLNTLKELENKPSMIICVNESVLINCDTHHKAFEAMKNLENLGTQIISCGACLEYFKKSKELKIGRIGNAYEILSQVFSQAKVVTL